MRGKVLSTVGAWLGVVSMVAAAPALLYSGGNGICSVVTVYITVIPEVKTLEHGTLPILSAGYNLPTTNVVVTTRQRSTTGYLENTAFAASGPAKTLQVSSVEAIGSSSGQATTTPVTTTICELVSTKHTLTSIGGTTRAETLELSEGSSHSTESLSSNAATTSTPSTRVEAGTGSSISIILGLYTVTVYSTKLNTITAINTITVLSGGFTTITQTSVSSSIVSNVIVTNTTTVCDCEENTGVASEIVVIETLTVIPLQSLPTLARSEGAITETQNSSGPMKQVYLNNAAASLTTHPGQITTGSGVSGTGNSYRPEFRGWNTTTFSTVATDGLSSNTATFIIQTSVVNATVPIVGANMFSGGDSIVTSTEFFNITVNSVLPTTSPQRLTITAKNFSSPIASISSSYYNATTVDALIPPASSSSLSFFPNTSVFQFASASPAFAVSAASSSPSTLTSYAYPAGSSISFEHSTKDSFNDSTHLLSSSSLNSALFSSITLKTGDFSASVVTATLLNLSSLSSNSLDSTSTASTAPLGTLSSSLNSPVQSFTTSTAAGPSSAPINSSSVSVTSTLGFTAVSSTSLLLPKPSVCGEHGDFTLNFDDIPGLAVSNLNRSAIKPEPLFSPYHQFYFNRGFRVVPPPTDPYLPSSGKQLTEFITDVTDPFIGTTAVIGSGETVLIGCFNFNAYGMGLGCPSTDGDCDWYFTGLRHNSTTGSSETVAEQVVTTVACPSQSNCPLVPVALDTTFENLTEIHIQGIIAGVSMSVWWMDDLKLGWFDNGCDAGLCRQVNV